MPPPRTAHRAPLTPLLWFGPLVVWAGLLLWSGAEGARYETSWRLIQWFLRLLCPEFAPPEADGGVQISISMYQMNGALRRLAHIAGYAILAGLTIRAIQRGNPQLKPTALIAAALLGLAYTGVDEIHRAFEPNRHAKWLDLILNLTGVGMTLLGTVGYFAIKGGERRAAEAEARTREAWEMTIPGMLSRVNTAPLAREGTLTRALVVFNPGDPAATGRVVFTAAFPIRADVGPRPVTIFDETGAVVSSRLTRSETAPQENLPADRVLWTLELEFYADVPAHHGRAYGSTFGASPESRDSDTDFWESLPLLSLPVHETECHKGELPLTFPLPAGFEGAITVQSPEEEPDDARGEEATDKNP